jgi:hypothetical protein
VVKDYVNSDLVQNFHKNKNLQFNTETEAPIISEKQFYKSPTHNGRQSSAYSVVLDKNGNVYYKRTSNHWGDFFTNTYDTDILRANKQAFEAFKKANPNLTENDFLQSLGYDTSDIYGRIDINKHSWDLLGGDVNKKTSQTGYIKIGNINKNISKRD